MRARAKRPNTVLPSKNRGFPHGLYLSYAVLSYQDRGTPLRFGDANRGISVKSTTAGSGGGGHLSPSTPPGRD